MLWRATLTAKNGERGTRSGAEGSGLRAQGTRLGDRGKAGTRIEERQERGTRKGRSEERGKAGAR